MNRNLASCTAYLPYEAYASLTPPGWWESKLPGEVVERSYDLTTSLTVAQIADLSSLSVSIYPSGTDEMVPLSIYVDGTTAVVTEYSGQPLRVYTILFNAQLGSGPTIEWAVQQAVRGILPTDQPQTVPMDTFCTPVSWCPGQTPLPPARQLPTITVAATGTTQLTAAPVTLAKVLVNAGAGGGICLPASSTFCGATMTVWNRSGGVLSIYPHAGDTIESNAVNAAVTLQDEATAYVSVATSGLLIVA